MAEPIYFHGGPRGRQVGDELLPPAVTGAPSLSAFGAGEICRQDRVYLTTRYEAALLFASAWPNGVIYRAEPVAPMEPDPDCMTLGLSVQCARAKVVEVIAPKKKHLARAFNALLS